jgi:hypothetical protein
MWIIPSELTDALRGIGNTLGGQANSQASDDDDEWVDPGAQIANAFSGTILEDPAKALEEARGEAGAAENEAKERAARLAAHKPTAAAAAAAAPAGERPELPAPPVQPVPPVPTPGEGVEGQPAPRQPFPPTAYPPAPQG